MTRNVGLLLLFFFIAACGDDAAAPCVADTGVNPVDAGVRDATIGDAGPLGRGSVLRGATFDYDCSGSSGSIQAHLRCDDVVPSRGIAGAFEIRASVIQAIAMASPTSGIDGLQIDVVDIACLARFREISGGAQYLDLACNTGAQLGPMFLLDVHGDISGSGLLTHEVGLAAASTNGLIACDPQASTSARASYSFTFSVTPSFAIVNDVVSLGG